MFTSTVREYVDAFARHSKNNVKYLHTFINTKPQFKFEDFDAIIVTYSCRVCYLELWSPEVRKALADYRGLKIVFLQDEYQETGKLRAGLQELGVKIVFTCVPPEHIEFVYPTRMFPGVRFEQVLTGYVPNALLNIPMRSIRPIAQRETWIGSRGRHIGHRFGDLGFYKVEIGRRFKDACLRRGIPCDIDWTEDARIYQDKWYPFISSCRTMLATPSGSNVFDFDGSIERDYKAWLEVNPSLTYDEYRPTIARKETEIDMGQASPRLFEAAALGTVLILQEGSYSGVVTPGVDCIVVAKDFSNVDDVLDQLSDARYLQGIADKAYETIIASGKWTYEKFITRIDKVIEETIGCQDQALLQFTGRSMKGYDQELLEALSLVSGNQYPLSFTLDLSHSRSENPAQQQAFKEALMSLMHLSPEPPIAGFADTVTPFEHAEVYQTKQSAVQFINNLKSKVPVWVKKPVKDIFTKSK